MVKHFLRHRQENPKDFIPSSFRTIKEGKDTDIIVGKLKPSHRKKGYSAWHIQSILKRK